MRVNNDLNKVAASSHHLINSVIHNFVYKMMKRMDIATADIHSGAFAYRFQALESLNIFSFLLALLHRYLTCHKSLLKSPYLHCQNNGLSIPQKRRLRKNKCSIRGGVFRLAEPKNATVSYFKSLSAS